MFPPMPPPLSPPSTAADLSALTEEQLRSTEADERSRVEARIHTLRNIQSLLDAAVAQMDAYVRATTAAPGGSSAATAPGAASSATRVTAEAADAADSVAVAAAQTVAASSPLPVPTAESGAVPKLPPKKSKVSTPDALDADSRADGGAAGAPAAEAAPSDVNESKQEAGDAGNDDASEIRRRRLEKLDSEPILASKDTEEATE